MKYRSLGNSGLKVSEFSFGTWAIGGTWGHKDDNESLKALDKAIGEGVNFFDTANVYGGGHSERLLAKATAGREQEIHIATKFCRSRNIHDPETYSEAAVREDLENSLKRLNREAVDLYQIHCAPLNMLKETGVFEVLEMLKQEGKIRCYGASVETVEEGLYCIENTGVSALQVIFNIFRQKPAAELFPQAKAKGVGILVRLPLASGLLTGKFSADWVFEEDDHRNFNANGEKFNVGETFAGLKFAKGVELSRKLEWIAEGRGNMTRAALRWIMDHDTITCPIPGFKNTAQVEDNLKALEVPSFNEAERRKLSDFYAQDVASHIRGPY